MVLAFSLAVFLLRNQAKTKGLDTDLFFNLSFVVLVSGIIGARILYIILNLGYYFSCPKEIILFSKGGLAWFGGLISGSIAFIVYLKRRHLGVYAIADLVIPYVALAQCIGRIGCFLNGCCFGKETQGLGVHFPNHAAILIPTQIYSSFALLMIFVILKIMQSGQQRNGAILYSYLFLYSIWRFFIEFLRGDTRIFIFGLTVFQIFSLVLFVLSVVMLLKTKKIQN